MAEVMAYLNGCNLPRIFNIRTLLVKFVSCACAVGSGLPVRLFAFTKACYVK